MPTPRPAHYQPRIGTLGLAAWRSCLQLAHFGLQLIVGPTKDQTPQHFKTLDQRALLTAGLWSLLSLPPHSPDLNPIEQLSARLKALLRKPAARTRDELCLSWAASSPPYRRANAPTTSTTAAMVARNVNLL